MLFTAFVCILTGLFIGWSGIAGFLLPILFIDYNGFTSVQALAISFLCFAAGGVIGSAGYYRKGQLELPLAVKLSVGSLIGASAGAVIGGRIDQAAVKIILYLVVLLSGISILIREILGGRGWKSAQTGRQPATAALVCLGILTGLICALSGAGGPVLVMPLLVVLGINAKSAVAAALFDSVFIALPSIVIYGASGGFAGVLPVTLLALVTHSLGVAAGTLTSSYIRQKPLKYGVAIFSIIFASYMLLTKGILG